MLAANIAQTEANAGPRSWSVRDFSKPANGATWRDWSTLTTPRVGYEAA